MQNKKEQSRQQLEEVKVGLEQTKIKKEALLKRKAEIDAIREKGGNGWTDELQKELENVANNITELESAEVGLQAAVAKLEKAVEKETDVVSEAGYVCPTGKEKMVHLLLQEGKRYSATTGKLIAEPFVQYFSRAEFELFKNSYKNLGFSVLKVLYDPYGEASKLLEA
jgi:hypothetical protein